ncbi:MAG: outer membrane channel protein [Rhodospirillaceae bacterium]|nr:MAG: outer membrane channel protein [Rhodospirillaceae bacterium]
MVLLKSSKGLFAQKGELAEKKVGKNGVHGIKRSLMLTGLVVGQSMGTWAVSVAAPLEEALVSAYLTNPQLEAQRAQVRGANETVNQALAQWRPSVTLDGERGRGRSESGIWGTNTSQVFTSHTAQITVQQPLYRGGRTVAQEEQAEAKIRSDWQKLVRTEQDVLLAAATAYLNLWRDEAVLVLNTHNEQVLQRQAQATRERFAVGALESSRATYAKVTGQTPESLALPQPLAGLPTTRKDAVALARNDSPAVASAVHTADAATSGIRLVRGGLWPEVSTGATLGRTWASGSVSSHTETAQLALSLNVPLYRQGLVDSRLRAAKHTAGQNVHEVENARRLAVASAVQAWEGLESAKAQIRANAVRIAASTTALEGVERESQVGSRTVLDVLDAEQELLDARVALTRAERDERVSAFKLLAAVGRMTARAMNLPLSPYDPETHYNAVRGQWFGTSAAADADAKEREETPSDRPEEK